MPIVVVDWDAPLGSDVGEAMVTPTLGRYGAYIVAGLYNHLFPSGRVQVLEDLGYGTVWIAGNAPGDLEIPETVLAQTKSVAVATAIVNVWAEPADKVAASFHRVERQHPGRFLLGVGIGHREAIGGTYQKPYEVLSEYVDRLLQLSVPRERIILAALRTKVLRLSGNRAAGALSFFTTVEHTKKARETLGRGPVLAVVQSCVAGKDRAATRSIVREWAINPYLNLQNYVNNLKETGFPDLQLGDDPSHALLDALVPPGGIKDTVARIQEHLSAGASHVPVFPLPVSDDPIPAFRLIADQLKGHEAEH